jgi:hypothetical protein
MPKEVTRKHLVISDTQVAPGTPTDHLEWLGRYIVDKKPDVIVHVGDHPDMPSLCSYDKGQRSYEGRRYRSDIEASTAGMHRLLKPLREYQAWTCKSHKPRYEPEMHYCYGNHDYRIVRATELEPMLEGTIGLADLGFEAMGWKTHPFLEVILIDGVAYSHYFVSGVMGRPVTSARAMLTKHHMSCVAGHQQGRDIAYAKRGDGTLLTGIITGSFYLNDQDYLNWQTNQHWRGVYVLHEVRNGSFDEMAVSVNYLKRKYG